MLGITEGIGNVGEVMEAVIEHYKHSLCHVSKEGDSAMVDWKRVYRDFDKLLDSMKDLVIRTADSAGSSEIDERIKSAARCHTARNKLSLMEMLDICKELVFTREVLSTIALILLQCVSRPVNLMSQPMNSTGWHQKVPLSPDTGSEQKRRKSLRNSRQ